MDEGENADDFLEEIIETKLNHLDQLGEDDYLMEMVGESKNYEKQERDAEELLMEQYELETGKSAITSRKTVRKSFLKWKKEQ